MQIIGVIPARFASTRFPGKPLALLAGKPMIQWVIEGAQKSKKLSQIIVATDHPQIAQVSTQCGASVVMTDPSLPSGTDRVWMATRDLSYDVVVNIQGDEPFVNGELIDSIVSPFADAHIHMATLAHPFHNYEEINSLNVVKVLVNEMDEAIYFSRYAIPYSRSTTNELPPQEQILRHVGMYAYRKDFLEKFCHHSQPIIELGESLEQLRALYMGGKIKVLKIANASLGVDTPEDLAKAEAILLSRK